jgi:hypothetical protein
MVNRRPSEYLTGWSKTTVSTLLAIREKSKMNTIATWISDNYSTLISFSMPVSIVFFMNLKRRSSFICLWVYSWTMVLLLAINEWHFHEQWLTIIAQQHDGGWLLSNTSADHYQSLRWALLIAAMFLFMPAIWYWFDRWIKSKASKSIQAV